MLIIETAAFQIVVPVDTLYRFLYACLMKVDLGSSSNLVVTW